MKVYWSIISKYCFVLSLVWNYLKVTIVESHQEHLLKQLLNWSPAKPSYARFLISALLAWFQVIAFARLPSLGLQPILAPRFRANALEGLCIQVLKACARSVSHASASGVVQMLFHFFKPLITRINLPNRIRKTTIYRQSHHVFSCMAKTKITYCLLLFPKLYTPSNVSSNTKQTCQTVGYQIPLSFLAHDTKWNVRSTTSSVLKCLRVRSTFIRNSIYSP